MSSLRIQNHLYNTSPDYDTCNHAAAAAAKFLQLPNSMYHTKFFSEG